MLPSATIPGGKCRTGWRDFPGARGGNVAIIFALMSIPLLFSIGMGVDYTTAAYREDQLNAYADAAALAAVTPAMVASTDAASVAAAENTFNAQADAVSGVTYDAGAGLIVTALDTSATRTVTVSYRAESQNFFPNVLGVSTIALAGTSTAVFSVNRHGCCHIRLVSSVQP